MDALNAKHGGGSVALVVDADVATAAVLRQELRDIGFATETASTGVDGIVAARRSTPALVFVALQLNDVRGAEFVGWMRSNAALASVPVVAIRALGEVDPIGAGQTFAAVLTKPIPAAAIHRALTTALHVPF